jgi:CHAT domain
MRTALIRIEERDGTGLTMSLDVDDGGDSWAPQRVAQDAFALPDAPPVALAGADGQSGSDVARRVVLEGTDDSPHFRSVGSWLFNALTSNEAGERWQQERGGAQPLRTLLDVRPAGLAELPWELLWDPARPLGAFAETVRPCSRVQNFKPSSDRAPEWWPLLRVMVIMALDDDEDAALELAGIHDGFAQVCGLVDLDIVRRPEASTLAERYHHLRPHVLHYIGHGQPGQLDFAAPEGKDEGWPLDAASLAALLQEWQPRLAVINACRSRNKVTSLEDQTGVFGISDTMVDAGVTAVVSMQADVREDCAAEFSSEFWSRVGSGVAVDEAVARARAQMATVGSWSRRDPWLPVLTASIPPEDVLPRLYPLPAERRRVLARTPAWETVHHFIDRGDQRRQIWRDIIDISEGEGQEGIVVLGPSKIGKTAVARWCVGAAALRGRDAAYVDLNERFFDPLSLLAEIAEELCRTSGNDARVTGPLDVYIARVDELHDTGPPQHAAEPTEGRYRRTLGDVPLETLDAIYEAFREALAAIAGEERLLLALDHLLVPANDYGPGPGSDYWVYFVRNVLARLDEARTVCLITAHTEAEATRMLGSGLTRQFRTVELPELKRVELSAQLGQLLRAHSFRRSEFGAWITRYVAALPDSVEGVDGEWVDGVLSLAAKAFDKEPSGV